MAEEMDSRQGSQLDASWDDFRSDGPEDDLQSEKSTAVSLIRKNSEEDVESLDGIDTASEMTEDEAEQPAEASQASLSHAEDGHGSSLTARPSCSQIIHLQSEKDSDVLATDFDMKYTMFELDKTESMSLVNMGLSSDTEQLFGSVRMKVSKDTIDLDRPLRIMYIGDSSEVTGQPSKRARVLAKVGDALMAGKPLEPRQWSMDSSLYHVIPTSFDDADAPTELVPIHAQIVVDECVTAASLRMDQGLHEQIFLRFKKARGSLLTSTWTGDNSSNGGYEVAPSSAWSAPDLAILFYSSNDDAGVKERLRLAHEFMKRHKVPMLLLTEKEPWGSSSQTPWMYPWSLRFCIETATTILRDLPIDLKTFEDMDAQQLNQHLKYVLVQSANSRAVVAQEIKLRASNAPSLKKQIKDVEKNMTKSFYQKDKQVRHFLKQRGLQVAMALMITLLTSLLAYTLFWIMSPASPASLIAPLSHPLPAQVSATLTTTATSVVNEPSAYSSSTLVVPSIKVETSLSTIPQDVSLAKSVLGEITKSSQPSHVFEAKVFGALVILKPNREFRNKKGCTPGFSVSVCRNNQSLDIEVEKMFYDVYTVKIQGGEAFGKLDLVISVEKPHRVEVHELDFGTPWFKKMDWKQSAGAMQQQVIHDLMGFAGNSSKRISDLLGGMHIAEKVESAQKEAMKSFLGSLNLAQKRTKHIYDASAKGKEAVSSMVTREVGTAFESLSLLSQSTTNTTQQMAYGLWEKAYSGIAQLTNVTAPSGFNKRAAGRAMNKAQRRAQFLVKMAKNRMARKGEASDKA